MVFLGGISLLPVLIQRIRDLRQPRPVLDLFQQFRRGKKLDAVRCRIPQRLEQARGDEDRHIMRLVIKHPASRSDLQSVGLRESERVEVLLAGTMELLDDTVHEIVPASV
ncbi:MAG: hypothetical protein ABSH11_08845 [Verrucomicrobiota bacterium]|jgi:hypothetical protein